MIKTLFIKYFKLIAFIILFISCERDNPPDKIVETDSVRRLVVLHTNDEHGWMEETTESDGAAKLTGLWKETEGLTNESPFLILSGGDNWTGPAISTWFQGESMVAVMNQMGYDAAAIGNHEFDFKIPKLEERIAQADFEYLSCNIRTKSTNEIPDFATPYVIKVVNNIRVGIIGLTTTSTPYTTFPDHVEDYNFINYITALEEIVPKVKSDGAELLIVTAHMCRYEMENISSRLSQLGISLIGGGHCNDLIAEKLNGVGIIEGGDKLAHYARAEIYYNIDEDKVVSLDVSTHNNSGGGSDSFVAEIVSYWQTQTEMELGEIIGYVDNSIERYSAAMHNIVTDSWLVAYPEADISMTNSGGIRAGIPAGDITIADIITVLPFDNNIISLQLTGAQVKSVNQEFIIGGMTRTSGYFLMSGEPIQNDSVYQVLTTDYLYARDDNDFHLFDTNPVYTNLNYHQPTIDWIQSLETDPSNPLDSYLDSTPR